MSGINEESLFYSPNVSAYKFFKMFFTVLRERQKTTSSKIIKGEIVKQLFSAKESGNYDDLLQEFIFFDNGIFVYSKQVENGISQMQLSGLISKKNPRFVELIVNDELSSNSLTQTDEDLMIFKRVESLVEEFVN